MSKPRDLQAVQTDYNQKLHRIGTLTWQLEHLIPQELDELKEALKGIEREAKLLQKTAEAKAAAEAKNGAKAAPTPASTPGVELQPAPAAQQ